MTIIDWIKDKYYLWRFKQKIGNKNYLIVKDIVKEIINLTFSNIE